MFLIKCTNCSWQKKTIGSSKEITNLKEIKNSCSNCGKPRVFICPKCKHKSKMLRIS